MNEEILAELQGVKGAIQNLRFPVPGGTTLIKDADGNALVSASLNTTISGEDENNNKLNVYESWTPYGNLAATTQIKNAIGVLGKVIVNTAGGSGCTLTVYDDADAGTDHPIGVITATATGVFTYNCDMARGIYVVVGGTAGSLNYTVTYI